jgi:hypothetical protein
MVLLTLFRLCWPVSDEFFTVRDERIILFFSFYRLYLPQDRKQNGQCWGASRKGYDSKRRMCGQKRCGERRNSDLFFVCVYSLFFMPFKPKVDFISKFNFSTMAQWKYIYEALPSDGQDCWLRVVYSSAAPIRCTWVAASSSFHLTTTGLVYPAYMCFRWRSVS